MMLKSIPLWQNVEGIRLVIRRFWAQLLAAYKYKKTFVVCLL